MIKYRNPIPINYTTEDNKIIKAQFGTALKQLPKVIKAVAEELGKAGIKKASKDAVRKVASKPKKTVRSAVKNTKNATKKTVKKTVKNNTDEAVKNGQYVRKPENLTPEELRQRYIENQEEVWVPEVDYGIQEEIPSITIAEATPKPSVTVNPVAEAVQETVTVKPKARKPRVSKTKTSTPRKKKQTVSEQQTKTQPEAQQTVKPEAQPAAKPEAKPEAQQAAKPAAQDPVQEIGLIRRIYGFEKPTKENMVGPIVRDALRVPLWAGTADLGLNLAEKIGSALNGEGLNTELKFPLYNLVRKPLKKFYSTADSTQVKQETNQNVNQNIQQNDTIKNGQDSIQNTVNYGEILFNNLDNSNF